MPDVTETIDAQFAALTGRSLVSRTELTDQLLTVRSAAEDASLLSLIDETVARLGERELISTSEAIDALLDLRASAAAAN